MSSFSFSNQDYLYFLFAVDMVTSPCKTCNNCEKMKKDMKKMKRDISYMTDLVENTNTHGVQLWEFLEETKKELQQQQNSRTESATGRKHSKEKQKVDPLCRVSHLSKK